MAPEDVLDRTPNVLSRDQQESYFANGYLLIEQAIDSSVLEKLRAATAQARLPVEAQLRVSKPNSNALVAATETTLSLNEYEGLTLSFLM